MERDESFQIELTETTGGATLGKISKTVVTIVNDEGKTICTTFMCGCLITLNIILNIMLNMLLFKLSFNKPTLVAVLDYHRLHSCFEVT